MVTKELEPVDFPQGYYHVYVDYANGHRPVVVDLEKLADVLPHGSGINGDWHIAVKRNGDIQVFGEYHQMNGDGCYCGWVTFKFSIKWCKKTVYHALTGPCAGKFQVTKVQGRVYLESFMGGGDNGDYLYDVVSCTLADELRIYAISSDVVSSEDAAKAYR